MLIVLSFWNVGTLLYGFQNLSVELTHLHCDGGDGHDVHEPLEIRKVLIFAMFQGRRKPIIPSPSVVKSRFPITKSGSSLFSIHQPVIVAFLLIRKGTYFHGR